MQSRAFQTMFVGFEDAQDTNGWCMYKKVYTSADVQFMRWQYQADMSVSKVNHITPEAVDGGVDSGDDESEMFIVNTSVKVSKQGKDPSDNVTDMWEEHEQGVLVAAVRATDVFESKTYRQTIKRDDSEVRGGSMSREVTVMFRHKVFKVIRITDLPPVVIIISARFGQQIQV